MCHISYAAHHQPFLSPFFFLFLSPHSHLIPFINYQSIIYLPPRSRIYESTQMCQHMVSDLSHDIFRFLFVPRLRKSKNKWMPRSFAHIVAPTPPPSPSGLLNDDLLHTDDGMELPSTTFLKSPIREIVHPIYFFRSDSVNKVTDFMKINIFSEYCINTGVFKQLALENVKVINGEQRALVNGFMQKWIRIRENWWPEFQKEYSSDPFAEIQIYVYKK